MITTKNDTGKHSRYAHVSLVENEPKESVERSNKIVYRTNSGVNEFDGTKEGRGKISE